MRLSKSQNFRSSISTAENEQQLFNDNTRSTFGDRLHFFNYDDELKDDLNLKLSSGEKKTLENDEFIETWEGNDEGLLWGKKEAKDKSWKEEWIEQRNIPKDSNISQVSYSEDELPNHINFQNLKSELREKENEEGLLMQSKFENTSRASLGQLIGVDYRKNRKWKEKWFRRGQKLFVRKYVQQFCENNSRVINVWFEDSEFRFEQLNFDSNKSSWKLVRNNKYGKKMSDQKEWNESNYFFNDCNIVLYEERGVSNGSNDYPYFYSKRKKVYEDKSEIIYSKYYKGNSGDNEVFDIETTSSSFNDSDQLTFDDLYLANSDKDNKYSESWKECIEIDSYGNKKGRKYGNRDKTEWHEVWFEEMDGSKECDIWYENSELQWGEKSGYSKSNNERFNVKWEKRKDQGGLREEKYIEKNWEKVGEQNSWGEKHSEFVEHMPSGKKIRLLKENWYNNGTEVFKEESNEEKQFNSKDQDELPILTLRSGKKRGERLTTGETWSEDWNENLGQCGMGGEIIRTELFTNKWWTKKNGEKWGEKKMIKLKQELHNQEPKISDEKNLDLMPQDEHLYIENNEMWYSSELEEYSDTWEIDGLNQRGFKKGIDRKYNKNRFIKWEEEWNKDHLDVLKKKYTWELMDESGIIEAWTEDKLQDQSGNSTINKRGKKYNLDNRIEVVEEWEEICNDDGNGNVHTIKQGKGKENWYKDEFGKSNYTGEQWAVKQGFDKEGSWSERWSERPDYKEAWKKGENSNGDKWEEEWKEDFKNKWKWARKSGENNIGDKWREEWREEVDSKNHISKKSASKKGKKMISGEKWSEEWGELYYGIGNEFMGDGGINAEHMEKWTNKYATDGSGNEWGNSWGDMWSWSTKVKSWGEKWENNYVIEKW